MISRTFERTGKSAHFALLKSYLTTVVSTDIVDGILATGKRRVGGYGYLISNKRDWTEQDEWSNCFIKNAHKISMGVPLGT